MGPEINGSKWIPMTRVTGRRKACRVALRVRCRCDVTAAPRWNPSPGSSSCTKLDVFLFSRRVSTTAVGGVVPDFPSVWVCLCTSGDEQPCLWNEGSHWAGRRKNVELDTKAEPTPPPTSLPCPTYPHTHPPFSTPHNPHYTPPPPPLPQEVDVNPEFMCEWLICVRACVRAVTAGRERQRKVIRCVRAVCCSI